MRSHAKAATAGSTQRRAGRLGLGRLASLTALSLLALLFSAVPALGATVTNQRPFLFAFDGSDATAGAFTAPKGIAVDNATGALYVANKSGGAAAVSKFDSDGAAAPFALSGVSSLFGGSQPFVDPLEGIAVDNSGGANQGRLHVAQGGRLDAFAPNGGSLWAVFVDGATSDVAVDLSGHLWTVDSEGLIAQYDNVGAPPPTLFSRDFEGSKAAIDFDASGNAYLINGSTGGPVEKYAGADFDQAPTILDPEGRNLYVDQSSATGHIFISHFGGDFLELDATGAPIGTFGGAAAGEYPRFVEGIAYNPALDRVYVVAGAEGGFGSIDAPVVAAFGPAVSGTVPDLTIDPPTGVGISSAHLTGTVDPQAQSGSYHFEWKRPSVSWAAATVDSTPDHIAGSSPAQPLPAGPGASPVEFDVPDTLRGNTTYEVRLATVNAGDGLRGTSEFEEFTTAQAPEAPAVTIDPPTGVASDAATITGTIDPQGDTAEWRVQIQKGCAGEFADQPQQLIGEGSEAPVVVQFDLEGLLPSERYCVRISATNSFGTEVSAVEELETDPVVPSGAETAFAAPRTDTSARLNGRVDPEGEDLTYHFEYSDDDGATWNVLPDLQDTSEVRGQKIVLGQELTGLAPETTYLYRFLVENPVGEASPQGGEKSFTTRTSAEMTLPAPRGAELVNSPDKGNQDALVGFPAETIELPIITPDAGRALWKVRSGAPGAPNGTINSFLAKRTATGWQNQPVAPPAAEQLGGGDFSYRVDVATPDFTKFVAFAGENNTVPQNPSAVRLDDARNQDVLALCPPDCLFTGAVTVAGSIELSDDGTHVIGVTRDETPRRLLDIGSGTPELLSVMPDDSPVECNIEARHHKTGTADASRVYFLARPNESAPGCGGPFGLYVRDREAEATTLIDPGTDGILTEPVLLRATPDGRSLYFHTFSNLDPADANSGRDAYRWDEASGESTCLTCVVPDAAVESAVISADFSHIYFRSLRQLIPGLGVEGARNVYVLSGGEVSFVATVGPSGTSVPPLRPSADGNVLLFGAQAQPTADQLSGAPSQLYLYDDRDRSLECISCRRDGKATSHEARDVSSESTAALSADGSTAAFATNEALVPLDVNNERDVYEWRNGAIRLITDGVSDFPVGNAAPKVAAVDADGSDVFFTVAAPGGLTGFEHDGVANFYDSRIGGGFIPPSPSSHCEGDSCQGPLEPSPALSASSSAGFTGRGNTAPERDCASLGRRVAKLNGKARSLRRQANGLEGSKAKPIKRKAARLEAQAKRISDRSARCRRAGRSAAR